MTKHFRSILVYAAIFILAIAAFTLIRNEGERLYPVKTTQVTETTRSYENVASLLVHLLLALATVVTVARLLGWLFRFIGQPPVIGEVVGGILIGPSFLGTVAPSAYHFILPPELAPILSIVSQLGVILYMFLVGLDLNTDLLRTRMRPTIATSHASIMVPFLLGSLLALYLYPDFANPSVPFTSFSLFMGLAMSITAFPVLARILSDTGLIRTELGTTALICASFDDVTAWCLLALVVGVVQTGGRSFFLVASLTIAYIIFLLVFVRPLAARLSKSNDSSPPQGMIAVALVAMLISALLTEVIGIHAIFGAFLLGAIIPHDSNLSRGLTHRLHDIVTILLLPAYFAFTGMRTEIGLVSGLREWLVCGLIILVATMGKFGGTFFAARFTGLGSRTAAALGVLMNTRGLMELIVLNVGLDLGVISSKLFTMMVLMALVTTIITTPIVRRLAPAEVERVL